MKHLPLCLLGIAVATLCTPTAWANEDLARKNGCAVCHAMDKKIVGPTWRDIALKYKGDAQAQEVLAARVKAGGKGVWGQVVMPPQAKVSDADLKAILGWALAQ